MERPDDNARPALAIDGLCDARLALAMGRIEAEYNIALADEAATLNLGAWLGRRLAVGDVVFLSGDLGAGKTTLARGAIRAAMGGKAGGHGCEVPSPTFTLAQIYETESLTVWHFDLYRLAAPEEVYELGFEEALATGASLIEWPDRLGALAPPERLEITLLDDPASARRRWARMIGTGAWAPRLKELPT